jgi:hypothetical protein
LQLLKGAVAQWKMMIEHYEDMKRKRAVALKDEYKTGDKWINYTKLVDGDILLNQLKFTDFDSNLSKYTTAFKNAVDTWKKDDKDDNIITSTEDLFNDVQTAVFTLMTKINSVHSFTVPIDDDGIIFKNKRDLATAKLTNKINAVDGAFDEFSKTLPDKFKSAVNKIGTAVGMDYAPEDEAEVGSLITDFLTKFNILNPVIEVLSSHQNKNIVNIVDKMLNGKSSTIADVDLLKLTAEKLKNIDDKQLMDISSSHSALKKKMIYLDKKLKNDSKYILYRKVITYLNDFYGKIEEAIPLKPRFFQENELEKAIAKIPNIINVATCFSNESQSNIGILKSILGGRIISLTNRATTIREVTNIIPHDHVNRTTLIGDENAIIIAAIAETSKTITDWTIFKQVCDLLSEIMHTRLRPPLKTLENDLEDVIGYGSMTKNAYHGAVRGVQGVVAAIGTPIVAPIVAAKNMTRSSQSRTIQKLPT